MILTVLILIAGAAALAAIAFAFVFRNAHPVVNVEVRPWILYGLTLACVLSIAGCLLLFGTRAESYVRPPAFFLGIALVAGISVVQAIVAPSRRWLLIACIQAFLGVVVWSVTQTAMYPTVLGGDPWGHQWLTEQIAIHGHVPQQFESSRSIWPVTDALPYLTLPGMHILLSTVMLTLGVSYKTAAIVAIGIPALAIEMIVLAILGKMLFSERVGALAAIVIAFSDRVMFSTSNAIIPNVLGFALLLLCFLVLLRSTARRSVPNALLLLSLCPAILVSHSISYTLLCLTAVAVPVAVWLARRWNTATKTLLQSTVVLLTIAWVAYYAFVATGDTNKLIVIVKDIIASGFSEGSYEAASNASLSESLRLRGGMVIYLGVAALGALWVALHMRESIGISLVGIFAACLALSVAALLNHSMQGLSLRFWLLAEILGGIFVATVIMLFVSRAARQWQASVAVGAGVCVVLLAVVMLLGASNDRPLVPEASPRSALHESELAAAQFAIEERNVSAIASDIYFASRIVYLAKSSQNVIYLAGLDDPLSDPAMLLVRTSALIDRQVVFGGRHSQVGVTFTSDQVMALAEDLSRNRGLIYDGGGVRIMQGLATGSGEGRLQGT
ncbi:MAG TPA: hypothetical protein VNZ52_15865 [Candidatus Thermoplasmatota archaeon]|nr:hypothetical protein [Candidatus Thermoplasmatota archaeon]